eukprot:CAMPEP_0196814796 /NCGR_PEP_ID=MMETSP1362-20130617/45797_1 /TAXON_ID=163516 /ORGANISM="Leptocylindrus danicus, Strain CCMP1856" /LENGTH=316 /DNA_ID=CAMNT_0042191533 /DNA_START=53 /DNA_END=1000 /DNA_ORIENTATION=+
MAATTTTTSVMDMNMNALFTRPEQLVDAFMDGFNEHYWHSSSYSSSSSSLGQSPRLTTDVLNILDALPQPQKSMQEEEEEEEEVAVSIVDPHQERHEIMPQPAVAVAEPKKKSKKKSVGRPKGSGNKAHKNKDKKRGIKRPLSGYNEFYKATHQDARKVLQLQSSGKSNVQINQQAVTSLVGSKWKELSDDEKRVYNERARKNRRDYQKIKEMSKNSRDNDKACNAEKKPKHTTKSNCLLYSTDDVVTTTRSVGCIKGRMLHYRYNVVSKGGRMKWNLDSTQFHLTLSPDKVSCPPLGYYFCNGERKTLLSGDSEW